MRQILWITSFVLYFSSITASPDVSQETSLTQTICLNMIVKDEKDVIERALQSVKPLINYWVIVDTGSTDGTQQIIKNYMKDIPGELHERPWVNFEHNRNEALKLAADKGDYLLFTDADEYFEYPPNFQLPKLDKDLYYITVSHNSSNYAKIQLINNHVGWEWKGVLHEYISSIPANSIRSKETLENIKNIYTTEGARSKNPLKYQKDAEVLEAALKKEPNNSRYVFYLARSYRDGGNDLLALENFEKLSKMQAWDEEVFESLLQIALIKEKNLKASSSQVIEAYQRAFQFRPSRVEPLYYLANYLREKEDFAAAYRIAKIGVTIPVSSDLLFVQKWMYEFGMKLELSACAYWIGQYDECQKLSLDLLKNTFIDSANRQIVQNNLNAANSKLLSQSLKDLSELK